MYFMLFHHTHSLVPLSTQCLTEYLLCSLSLPDEFNQAPGSHRVHQRHPSISSSFSDFGDPLSQQEHFNMPSSFSQEAPMQRPREDHEFHRLHFSGSYEPEIMRGRSQYHQYGSDPYPNPPNFPPERQSCSLNHGNGRIMHADYLPGPMHRHHPPPPSPGGPFWDGYGPTSPTHMHGPPPPHSHPHPPPPRDHVLPFYPMSGFHPTTPDGPPSTSLSSMSPARSPNPTPATTPPPSHPPMMGMGPSPMRMAPPHHGNLGVLPLLDHVDQFLCMGMWTLIIAYHTHLHLHHLDLFHDVILFLILPDLWAHPHTTILIHMDVSLLLMDI